DPPWLVGARGFEPPTPSSRTMCATRLRYAPTQLVSLLGRRALVQLPQRPTILAQENQPTCSTAATTTSGEKPRRARNDLALASAWRSRSSAWNSSGSGTLFGR